MDEYSNELKSILILKIQVHKGRTTASKESISPVGNRVRVTRTKTSAQKWLETKYIAVLGQ